MQKRFNLNETEHQIMKALSYYNFATNKQLLSWSSVNDLTSITRTTKRLVENGFIEQLPAFRPNVFQLSNKGARVADLPNASRQRSFPAIQQYCHRNEAFLSLCNELGLCQLLFKKELARRHLYPSVAEHAALTQGGQLVFFLVDDYLMSSNRIKKSWLRNHSPDKRHFSAEQLRERGERFNPYWHEKADYFYVYTTDDKQKVKHQAYIEKEQLPAVVRYIEPLWDYTV